jgi:hypothetical protein
VPVVWLVLVAVVFSPLAAALIVPVVAVLVPVVAVGRLCAARWSLCDACGSSFSCSCFLLFRVIVWCSVPV